MPVDYVWVREQLVDFVEAVKPVNGSGRGVITTQNFPACGRVEAIRKSEVISDIFNELYPNWNTENEKHDYFEFGAHQDAAMKLIARIDTQAETRERLGLCDSSPTISASSMHPIVWEAAKAQWNQENHAEAVSAVARAVNSMLQKRLDRRDVSESDLVRQAFSDKDPKPGKPRLRFPEIASDDTRESVRRGVMEFGAGCFAAIRNPLAHLADDEIDISEQEALESLAAFSWFARRIDAATLVTADD